MSGAEVAGGLLAATAAVAAVAAVAWRADAAITRSLATLGGAAAEAEPGVVG